MRTATWLSMAFAFALVFAADCVAAPPGGNAKKRSRGRAEEPALPASTGARAVQAAGLRLCISAATKADSKLVPVIARNIGTRGPAFQSVQAASEGERTACDIIATVAGEGVQPANIHSVVVASAHTQTPLWAGQSTDSSLEGVAAELANKVFEAFKEGAVLRKEALADRAGQPAADASSPAAAPSAPLPPAQRKPPTDAQPAADASIPAAAPSAPPPPAKRKPLTKAQRQKLDSQLQP